MENRINIAEILKKCPKGMELDCTMFEDVKFIDIDEADKPICIKTGDIYRFLTKFGTWTFDENAKCVIFPKGKTTWEGFQRPFVEGDIVFYNNTIAIFKEWGDETLFRSYVIKYLYKDCDTIMRDVPLFGKGVRKEIRFATEEEKAQLFKSIENNGYRWNPETKTLEKLPKFKDGDILANDDDDTVFIYNGMEELSPSPRYYVYVIAEKNDLFFALNISTKKYGTRFATEEEKAELFKAIKDNGYRWNPETKKMEKLVESKEDTDDKTVMSGIYFNREYYADEVELHIGNYEIEVRDGKIYAVFKNTSERLIEPKFKVGDKIKHKNTVLTIISVRTNSYLVEDEPNNFGILVFSQQDKWELINEPKFKVGDRIKNKLTNDYYSVIDIKCREYYIRSILTNKDYQIPFESEINYELVPNKFNINNLKPFDKVLVRDFDNETWEINFFSKLLDGKHFKCLDLSYVQCIPYEGNEHLFNTTNKCDEFFKVWKS